MVYEQAEKIQVEREARPSEPANVIDQSSSEVQPVHRPARVSLAGMGPKTLQSGMESFCVEASSSSIIRFRVFRWSRRDLRSSIRLHACAVMTGCLRVLLSIQSAHNVRVLFFCCDLILLVRYTMLC